MIVVELGPPRHIVVLIVVSLLLLEIYAVKHSECFHEGLQRWVLIHDNIVGYVVQEVQLREHIEVNDCQFVSQEVGAVLQDLRKVEGEVSHLLVQVLLGSLWVESCEYGSLCHVTNVSNHHDDSSSRLSIVSEVLWAPLGSNVLQDGQRLSQLGSISVDEEWQVGEVQAGLRLQILPRRLFLGVTLEDSVFVGNAKVAKQVPDWLSSPLDVPVAKNWDSVSN